MSVSGVRNSWLTLEKKAVLAWSSSASFSLATQSWRLAPWSSAVRSRTRTSSSSFQRRSSSACCRSRSRAARCIPASTLTPVLASTQMTSRAIASVSWTLNWPKTTWTRSRVVTIATKAGPTPPSSAAATTAGRNARYGAGASALGNAQRSSAPRPVNNSASP
jgi:hypothetical protein